MPKIDKLVEFAKSHLDPGEPVLAAVQGTYEAKMMGEDWTRAGVLVATPSRVVFYAKKMGGYDLESFHYDRVSSFEQAKNMMGHNVTFFASGNKVHMKWINDVQAMGTFVDTVRANLGGPRNVFTSPAHNGPPPGYHPSEAIPNDLVNPTSLAGSPDRSHDVRPSNEEDVIDTIRRLGELHQAGILSDSEFTAKKAELLSRL